jgi:hypothetical protein
VKLIIDITEGAPTYIELLTGLSLSVGTLEKFHEPVTPGDGGPVGMMPKGGRVDWVVVSDESVVFPQPGMTPNPLDYECPVCGALAGKYCSVPGSRGRRQVPWVHPVRETIARAHALGTDDDEESSNA